MMKKISFLLASTTAVVSLVGCENLMTRNDIRETEQKKQFQEQVSTIQKSSADAGNRFADIEGDLRNLNGRVEVVENRLNQNAQEAAKARGQAESTAGDQNKRVQILQEEVAKLTEEMATLTAEVNAMKAAVSESSSSSSGAKKDLYEQGEENFDKKEWKKAIVNYQKFRDANPKSKKFPDATYKIGVCFQELGLKDEAKTFYDELVAKFPNSAEAKKAKTRLKSLSAKK